MVDAVLIARNRGQRNGATRQRLIPPMAPFLPGRSAAYLRWPADFFGSGLISQTGTLRRLLHRSSAVYPFVYGAPRVTRVTQEEEIMKCVKELNFTGFRSECFAEHPNGKRPIDTSAL